MNNSNSLSNIEKEKFLEILKALFHDNQSTAFQEPVDYIELNLPEYPEIIKNPMDLGTIKEKLENDEYSDINQIVNDFDLIWENCFTFNKVGSDIYKSAQYCKKLFKKQMERYFKISGTNNNQFIIKKDDDEIKEDESKIQLINLQEKIELGEKIRKLNMENIPFLFKFIQKECPKIINDLSLDKIELKLDLLDKKCYNQMINLIDSFSKKNN